jgi:hypothetical protein
MKAIHLKLLVTLAVAACGLPAAAAPDPAIIYAWFKADTGTSTNSAGSALKLDFFPSRETNGLALAFPAVSNKSYTLQTTSSLSPGTWLRLLDVPAGPTNAVFQLPVIPTNSARFFRVTTPQTP